jgi:hypothetical protein
VRSTIGSLEDFKDSLIWQDICEEFDVWLEEIRNQLENPDIEMGHRTLDQLGGNAKALRRAKGVLDVLINLAQDEIDNQEKEKGGRND